MRFSDSAFSFHRRIDMIGIILVFVLSLQPVRSYESINNEDYVDILMHGENTGVEREEDEFPGRLLEYSKVKLSFDQYDRKKILFEHNSHRKSTEPPASDMVFMVWSLHLQQTAASIVGRCAEIDTLSEDEKTMLETWFSSVGINTWKESAMYKFVMGNVIHTWTEEKNFYSFNRNTCKLGKNCDRYIQVIWSTASHVGCELSFCPIFHMQSRVDRDNIYSVVCVYGEGKTRIDDHGNYSKPFTSGEPCGSCPTGFPICVRGLCQTKPPCDTVVDCKEVVDREHCLCQKSIYDSGHRLTFLHWTWMDIWFTGVILSSFIAS